jgi:hypothetical protein
MDILTLKLYRKPVAVGNHRADHSNNAHASVKRMTKAVTSTDNSDIFNRVFLEFFVNDKPLSMLLDGFYNQKGSILDNSVGVIGWTINLPAEVIKCKQLLGKSITEEEIRQASGSSFTKHDLDDYREELSNPEVLIYCCAECGDYKCGGVTVSILHFDDAVTWKISNGDKSLKFQFAKSSYYDLFKKRIMHLEDRIGKR